MRSTMVAVLAMAVLGPGCDKKSVMVTLTPTEVVTKSKQAEDHAGFPCAGISQLTTCMPEVYTPPPAVFVGFSRGYEKGTSPVPCWAWVSCASRAYVRFDLSSVPSADILTANLRWSPTTQKQQGGVASNDGTCIEQIYVAKAPWGPFAVAGESLDLSISPSSLATSALVGEVVTRWKKGEIPNYGFFFVGPDESLPGKSADDCLTEIGNIKMDVVAAVKK